MTETVHELWGARFVNERNLLVFLEPMVLKECLHFPIRFIVVLTFSLLSYIDYFSEFISLLLLLLEFFSICLRQA